MKNGKTISYYCFNLGIINGKIYLFILNILQIRKVIYTTNIIESVHRQFRKLTKTKGAFPNENSLLKLLYMGIQNATKKWNMPMWNWNLTLSQLAIFLRARLDSELKI